ncbi:chloride channel protein [bacterium]|nr:chloride channel protein [bacterium]
MKIDANTFDPRRYFRGANFFQLRRGNHRELAVTNLLAALTGIIAGYAALGFRGMISFFQNLFLLHSVSFAEVSPLDHVRGLWIILFPAVGLTLSYYTCKWFAPEAEGHGVPEVIEAVMAKGGRMKKRVVIVKALASSLTIGSGGSVGQEGPVVQIGSAAGSAFGQLFQVRTKLLKILVGCGATGAIAATFNTPIAGVIFAVELILFEFKFRSFVPLVIASVFATMITRIYLGEHVAFDVPTYSIDNPVELLFYIGLGFGAGAIAVFFIKTLYGIEDTMRAIKTPFFIKSIGAGLIVGLVGYRFPDIFGSGYDAISSALNQGMTLPLLLTLLILKIFMTSFTLAGGGSGGVFAPSLFLGAMFGGVFGEVLKEFFPDFAINSGAYALVGMAAFFAGASRATFTSIVILFEMTSDYSIILPLMLACVVSSETAWLLSRHSIYSLKLARRGLNMITDMGVNVIEKTMVGDIMTEDPLAAKEDISLEAAHERFSKYHHKIFPVINDKGVLLGSFTRHELETAYQKNIKDAATVALSEIVNPVANVAFPKESVQDALNRIQPGRSTRIFVVKPDSKKLIGVVSPSDFVRMMTKAEGSDE